MYDLADDPHEQRNLAPLPGAQVADPRIREAHRMLVGRMWDTMRTIGDESLLHTHYATLRTAPFGPLGDSPDTL